MEILHNHLGYPQKGYKKAILLSWTQESSSFNLLNSHNQVVYQGSIHVTAQPEHWGEAVGVMDFSDFTQLGDFKIQVGHQFSALFRIAEDPWGADLISDVLSYFKGQRCSGIYERQDRKAPFTGGLRRETKDVHGGWYDAAGDLSKYLSHLTYARFFNPQQTPLVVWALLKSEEYLSQIDHPIYQFMAKRALEEALHGADFLVRMQDEKGYFYQTLFDQWSKDPLKREICAYKTQMGTKLESWEASFRSGGGMAVAALAKAAKRGVRGDYAPEIYAEKALTGYDHLRTYNLQYNVDQSENLIDEYCALVAAVELAKLTGDDHMIKDASIWANAVVNRQSADENFDGFFRIADDLERPFFHASDAALPWIALKEYLDLTTDPHEKERVRFALERGMAFELDITHRESNPFGLAKQYVQGIEKKDIRASFFVPHDNETGYWWQGENARLAGMSYISMELSELLADQASDLQKYAHNQLNWILGLNPFDACMVYRHGRNNPKYEEHFPNAPGGVCNGITSRWTDDLGVQLYPQSEAEDRMDQRWRWGEQWIPHGAYFCLALARMSLTYFKGQAL